MALVFILALSAAFPFCGLFDGGSSAAAEGDTAESLPVETLAWESDFEVVRTTEELKDTTKDYVMVLCNDSIYGDRGVCIFEKMDATRFGYPRADGSHLYPIPGQGVLQEPNAPYREIMRVVESYCGRTNLSYGQSNTLYSDVCTWGIDCSAFVSAVLHGIDYDHSRYVLGTDSRNIPGPYPNMLVEELYKVGWNRLVTIRMAQYFAEQKQLFSLKGDDPYTAVEKLRFGDILFFSYSPYELGTSGERYYGIGHVALVLGTIPEENCIIIAQGGGSPSSITLFNNENTVVRTTVLKVTQEELETHLRLFARPRYASVPYDREEISAQYRILPDSIEYQPRFQLNTAIDSNTDGLTLSRFCASTVDYCPAAGGGLLIYTGPAKDDLTLFFAAEYDKDFDLIGFSELSDGYVLQNETRYLRFMCSREWIGNQITLNAVHDVSFSLYYSRQQDVAHDP